MILADHLFDFVLKAQKVYGLDAAEMDAARTVLSGAARYVFPKRTTEMAETAVRAPAKLAPFLSLPAKWTWVEFVDPMEGVLLNGSDELTGGAAIYASLEPTPSGEAMISLASAAFSLPLGGFMLGEKPDAIPERFQRRLMGALTLLGAPDLLERKAVQHSRSWNASRARTGKPVALDHETIELHLTRYEKDQEREWNLAQDREAAPGHRRRHHFVRAHIRIYSTGKVIKIPPHYRGDPALGEAPLTHIVRP